MKLTLEFAGDSRAAVRLVAETEAEQSILAFLTEGGRAWAAEPVYGYRVVRQTDVRLFQTTSRALAAEEAARQ